MGVAIANGITAGDLTIESDKEALRSVVVARGNGYTTVGVSGVVAAALAANSSVFAMRFSATAGAQRAYIDRIRLQYTTIVAYTTPVTAARRLALFRGAGAAASGGTAMNPVSKDTSLATSKFLAANGGDIRVATTAALTVTGITFETDPIAQTTLTHVGAAGGFIEQLWEFTAQESSEIILQPGELLAVRNPAAMDAAGTWQLNVHVHWREATAYP